MYKASGNLLEAAYWFKIAIEWGVGAAVDSADEYEKLLTSIALQLSEGGEVKKQGKAGAIIAVAVAVAVLVFGFLVAAVFGVRLVPGMGNEARPVTQGKSVSVTVVESRMASKLSGKTYESTDQNDNKIKYVLGEKLVFDKDNRQLYFEFGVIDYEGRVYLADGMGWRTEAISSTKGILKVEYPYSSAPSVLEIREAVSGSLINRINNLKVESVSSSKLRAKIKSVFDVNIYEDVSNTASVNSVVDTVTGLSARERLIGTWEYCNYAGAGSDCLDVERWTFTSNGKLSISMNYYYPSETGDFYYDGQHWQLGSGNAYSGTYNVTGSSFDVTMDVSEPGDPADRVTTSYIFHFKAYDQLVLEYSQWAQNKVLNKV